MINIISKKLFKEKLYINNIVLCYKLEELIKLQKQLEAINEKLSKIEFDDYDNYLIKRDEILEEKIQNKKKPIKEIR